MKTIVDIFMQDLKMKQAIFREFHYLLTLMVFLS